MNALLQSCIYLKAVLPLMEDLVAYDEEAAAAIAGENLVLQFEVKGGPIAHLDIGGGKIRHGIGPHPRPDVRLTFKSPELLNRLFEGEDVRPGIRKGFTHIGFLTKKFPRLSERLSYHLEGEGQKAQGPEADRFLVTLGLHAMLAGMATVANDDPLLAETAAETPQGTLLVKVLPDGPFGSVAKVAGGEFISTFGQPVAHPNAVMEFDDLSVARRLIEGRLSAVVAIGTGEVRIRGNLPLVEKINIFLNRFSKLMAR